MTPLDIFCRQVLARSEEHRKAIYLLHHERVISQVVAILREELDSMVRVIYLAQISDPKRRNELIEAAITNQKWTQEKGKGKVTDREMVEIADKLHGWTKSVYLFGCGFIHLSSFHDYQERDPLDMITPREKKEIIEHLRYYHGGPSEQNPTYQDILPYLPRVFEKIADNLRYHLETLKNI